MRENLLQFIWEKGYFNAQNLETVDGMRMEIISPGRLNTHQGPDFSEARIRIDDAEWVGNIELHTESRHWHAHGHQFDPAYGNVILHVVWKHRGEGPAHIPILELDGRVPQSLLKTYASWMNLPEKIPCAGSLSQRITEIPEHWARDLVREKLEEKSSSWLTELGYLKGHWEELCWRKIARNFGYKVNADAFEALGASVPLNVLAKHKGQIHQLEALLLGQAGLLYGNWDDPYPVMLQREYAYLRRMHTLKPIMERMQFLRMRPGNFPSVRIAQLAALVHQSSKLFSTLLEANTLEQLRELLEVTANDFWHYHYRFGKSSTYLPKTLGKQMIHNIIINTIVPLRYAYGRYTADSAHTEAATNLLDACVPEQDAQLRPFTDAGISPENAMQSQALHHLKFNYCDARRCLECCIGRRLLVNEIRNKE